MATSHERLVRDRLSNGKWVAKRIQTVHGLLTRREIAAITGVSLNTVHSRIFDGRMDMLFDPPRTHTERSHPREKRGSKCHDDSKYIEKWADRRARRAKERAGT